MSVSGSVGAAALLWKILPNFTRRELVPGTALERGGAARGTPRRNARYAWNARNARYATAVPIMRRESARRAQIVRTAVIAILRRAELEGHLPVAHRAHLHYYYFIIVIIVTLIGTPIYLGR